MKVLHVISTLAGGGAELQLLTLCRKLQGLGVEVKVAFIREHVKGAPSLRDSFEKAGIELFDLGGDVWHHGRVIVRLARLLGRIQPTILHTHLPKADFLGGLVRPLFPSLAWVCSVHGIYSEAWAGAPLVPLIRFFWSRADAVVAISNRVREWLVNRWKLAAAKVAVVYYGIDTAQFEHPNLDLRSIWGIREHQVIGTVGRLEPLKGHHQLIRAMPTILKRFPHAMLLIAGHDPWGYGQHLEHLVHEFRVQGAVRVLGYQRDIVSFLHALDVFAFLSVSEGFGQALVEAMAAGRCVIAARVSPLTEIVPDESCGLLIAPGDGDGLAERIGYLLGHPQLRAEMGRCAQEHVNRHFSASTTAMRIVEVYRRALKSRTSALPT